MIMVLTTLMAIVNLATIAFGFLGAEECGLHVRRAAAVGHRLLLEEVSHLGACTSCTCYEILMLGHVELLSYVRILKGVLLGLILGSNTPWWSSTWL